MWMRGLKEKVRNSLGYRDTVASYVDAWIERSIIGLIWVAARPSHPMWMRGLKENVGARSLNHVVVASYVDAWIES